MTNGEREIRIQAICDSTVERSLEIAGKTGRMKIICVLQNAWGDSKLPIVFAPNPFNKSAKTIRTKVLESRDVMHFCNTTSVVTPKANGKAKADKSHFLQVILRLAKYDVILVCGNQAKKSVEEEIDKINLLKKPVIYMPHPASRSLSNLQLAEIKKFVNAFRK